MINIVIKRLAIMIMIILGIAVIGAPHTYAVDPPHRTTDATDTWWCTQCHSSISSGTGLKTTAGNPNLCLSCHKTNGLANDKRLFTDQQAEPGVGGRNHRWDSGPAGYVTANGTSPGKILSGVCSSLGNCTTTNTTTDSIGTFTGTYPRIYEIKITTPGESGAAQFQYRYSDNGGAYTLWSASVTTGTDVALTDGSKLKLTFVNGASSPSFIFNDTWTLKVRPQINYPTTYSTTDPYANLTKKMFPDTGAPNDISDVDPTGYVYPGSTYGKAVCSTCHNQHFQTNMSNDPFSPSYDPTVPFSNGAGRHYQRIPNETNELCLDCHSARNISPTGSITNVETWQSETTKLSHPVGVVYGTGTGDNIPIMHSVPKEPDGADQSNKTTSGKATSAGTTTTMTDTNKAWTANELQNLYIRFTGGSNKGLIAQISGNTYPGQVVTFTPAVGSPVAQGDAYVIDTDVYGNPTNNLRLYDTTLGPNFTTGKVYCLTCHGPHWADSDETTYDAP